MRSTVFSGIALCPADFLSTESVGTSTVSPRRQGSVEPAWVAETSSWAPHSQVTEYLMAGDDSSGYK
ncbi:hypothetical protein [Aeoliella mucimassa]|uniref:hypothetical protein n=1 Tax=Aeoliella mucimassa TaxID=2527972 RepID=UPI0018D46D07|nr:hypothetical protein [Aeoliella mucimassa]